MCRGAGSAAILGRRLIHPVVVQTLTGKCYRQGSVLVEDCNTLVCKFIYPREGCVTVMVERQY